MNRQDRKVAPASIDPATVAEATQRHRKESNLVPDQYLRHLMIDLGKSIDKKKKIYLDTCYWIFLRDAEMDRPRTPLHTSLLQRLRQLVSQDIALCPISDVTITELLKQSDPACRRATARVVDELSHGVAIIQADVRVGTEFAHFLYDAGASADVHALDHLVWTKVWFVLGQTYPLFTGLPPGEQCALQKAFIDYVWTLPLATLMATIADAVDLPPPPDFGGIAQRLNAGNQAHVHELRTFALLVIHELAGVIDLHKELLADIVEQMYERQEGLPADRTDSQRKDAEALIRNAMVNLYRLRPTQMAKRAPTLYVGAKCYAAVRWTRNKNLTANDLLDFHHAAAALGYCDAFFTDKPLKVLLTQNHVQLSKELSRFITANDAEALQYLDGLTCP